MTKQMELVKEWMKVARQDFPIKPSIPSEETKKLRLKLIEDELIELREAFEKNDLIEVADALADLDYVIKGTWVACGLDDEPFFNEVHASNKTKFVQDEFGNLTVIKNHLGKVIKPSTYKEPNLKPILESML